MNNRENKQQKLEIVRIIKVHYFYLLLEESKCFRSFKILAARGFLSCSKCTINDLPDAHFSKICRSIWLLLHTRTRTQSVWKQKYTHVERANENITIIILYSSRGAAAARPAAAAAQGKVSRRELNSKWPENPLPIHAPRSLSRTFLHTQFASCCPNYLNQNFGSKLQKWI